MQITANSKSVPSIFRKAFFFGTFLLLSPRIQGRKMLSEILFIAQGWSRKYAVEGIRVDTDTQNSFMNNLSFLHPLYRQATFRACRQLLIVPLRNK